jgi:GlpG protein
MRAIGEILDEADAKLFGDYLYVEGIGNEIEEDDGEWTIWIHDDDQIEIASAALEKFLTDPADTAFCKKGAKAGRIRRQEANDEERARQRQVDVRTQVFGQSTLRTPHLTYGLIGLCVLIFLMLQGDAGTSLRQTLSITSIKLEGHMVRWQPGLPDILKGEVWRLFSPAFLHFGFLHIIFNMMWLHRLGGQFEGRLGTGWFALFLLATAIISNLAQYGLNLPPFFDGGPQFGGMSGVVYGLAGHAWIRGRLDPSSGVELDESTAMFLMIWFFICFLPFMPIANTAHTFGLLVGLAWGWIAAQRSR